MGIILVHIYVCRAITLTLSLLSPNDLQELARLAFCAGFEYAKVKGNYVEACVKPDANGLAEVAPFLKTQLRAVSFPPAEEDEYQYPAELLKSTSARKVRTTDRHDDTDTIPVTAKLFDGWNKTEKLSEHYAIKDFLCPNKRYFRLDENLVECLESTSSDLGEKVKVLEGSGYRVRSRNLVNIKTRHPEERYRFQTGQAVEVSSTKTTIVLLKQLVRSCLPILYIKELSLNLGVHSDRIYIDVRTANTTNQGLPLNFWFSETHKTKSAGEMEDFLNQVKNGKNGR